MRILHLYSVDVNKINDRHGRLLQERAKASNNQKRGLKGANSGGRGAII